MRRGQAPSVSEAEALASPPSQSGDTPGDARTRDSEHFFQRWSRRKLDARQSKDAASEPKEPPGPALSDADLASIDFEALDFDSNYARFMLSQTAEAARSKALRKLWASHPVFSEPDGLQDYAKDYTDAAARLSDAAQSAYRIGQGFLTDAELTAWAELGAGATQARLGCAEQKEATGIMRGRLQPETAIETDHDRRAIDATESAASEAEQNCTGCGKGDR